MAGTSFYMFRFRFMPEMFSVLSAAFLGGRAFRLFFCSFGCSLFCCLFGFRELIKQTSTVTVNGRCKASINSSSAHPPGQPWGTRNFIAAAGAEH